MNVSLNNKIIVLYCIACTKIQVHYGVRVGVAQNVKNFWLKFCKSLYPLNPWMDLVDTLPDVRYWSEVECCTITTHISDLEVKVTDFEILS